MSLPADSTHDYGAASLAEIRTRLQAEIDYLRTQLATSTLVEQAKGMLMASYVIDADAAYLVLLRSSARTRLGIGELSEALVRTVARTDGAATLAEALRWFESAAARRTTVDAVPPEVEMLRGTRSS